MDTAQPTRCVAALKPLFLAGAELGVDLDALLRRFDVDPAILETGLESGLARIDAALSTRIVLELARECGDAPLAVLAARHVQFGGLGVFDYVVSSALTVREAATLGSQFFGLLDETGALVLTEDGRQGSLALLPRTEPSVASPLAELAFVTIAQIVWTLLGHNSPCTEVRFAHTCTSNPRAYEAFFRCPVRFGAPRNELVFPRAFLEAHVRNGDPSARDAVTQLAAMGIPRETQIPAPRESQVVLRGGAEAELIERVRRAASTALVEGDGSLASLATRLHTSSRTLQRRLQQHGTSYAEILDQARRELATAHVAADDMSIAAIAERLGFADASTFARAFRRWTAMSPTDYRASRSAA